jgi:hypothetical protein
MTSTRIWLRSLLVTLCLGVLGIPFGCAGPPSVRRTQSDRTLAETTAAARTAFQQDRIDEAVTLYTLALKRARALDESSAIGDAAYNLAACLLRRHEYERASALLAEASYELACRDAPLADVLLLQARTAYLAGTGLAAGNFIHQLRTDSRSQPSVSHLAQAAMLEGRMACDRGDWDAATDLLEGARDALGPDADTLLQAQLAALAGRIAVGTHDLHAAAEAFDKQVDLLRDAHQYRALSSVLAQAGDARAVLNEHGLAADRLYRAARNAAAWGETASAQKWALAALASARQADDAGIVYLAESLLSEFEADHP